MYCGNAAGHQLPFTVVIAIKGMNDNWYCHKAKGLQIKVSLVTFTSLKVEVAHL